MERYRNDNVIHTSFYSCRTIIPILTDTKIRSNKSIDLECSSILQSHCIFTNSLIQYHEARKSTDYKAINTLYVSHCYNTTKSYNHLSSITCLSTYGIHAHSLWLWRLHVTIWQNIDITWYMIKSVHNETWYEYS